MRFYLLPAIACCVIVSATCYCQKKVDVYKLSAITSKDFDLSTNILLTADDDAAVLYASGSTRFTGNKKAWFSYVYTVTKRIKIIHKRAFNLANVTIPLYKDDYGTDIISDIKATTYNLNNNEVTLTSLDKNDIFTEEHDKNHTLKKFTFPAVQEGSIIEYSFTITSPFTFNMPLWKFQSTEYPVLWSQYQVSIPSALKYVFIRQGFDSFYINKKWVGAENYTVTKPAEQGVLGSQEETLNVNAGTYNSLWVEKDLAPLKYENYISSADNYIDKIEFQLAETNNGQDKTSVWNTWASASEALLKEDDFEQTTSADYYWIKDIDNANNNDKLEDAKNIYRYVQNNYTCTDTSDIFKADNLINVYKKQKGSVRGINLLLTAMLKKYGIYAEPVLLSTRDNGFVNPSYPVIDKFNYLICRAKINGKSYLLDATDALLGFGEIPGKCYNGYLRVINAEHPDSLYLSADSLHDKQITTLVLSDNDNGNISGAYTCTMSDIESEALRKKLKVINQEDYFKDIKKGFLFDAGMSNTSIDSLKQFDMPVTVKYDVAFNMDDDIVYFNPMMFAEPAKENPFKSASRIYPVEMPYCTDKTYVLNMEIPKGYKVDELPKSARVKLNEDEGMFEYLIQKSDDMIQLRCITKINKANFEPDDYETLRNFFSFIVEKEGEQIVFKKAQ